MLSFKQFITEAWEHEDDGYSQTHTHHSTVHGHDVEIYGSHLKNSPSGTHNLAYCVNGGFSKTYSDHPELGHASPEHAMAILKHVHKTINHYIGEHKPKALKFTASDTSPTLKKQKEHLYHQFANKIASDHNGHVEVGSGGSCGEKEFRIHLHSKPVAESKMLGKVTDKPYKYKHVYDYQTKDGKVRVKDAKKRNWSDEEEQDHLAYERGYARGRQHGRT